MRIVYGAVFFGFAFVGFASVCNTHSGAAARTLSSPAQQQDSPTLDSEAPASTIASAVTVRTDLVEPGLVPGVTMAETHFTAPAPATVRRPMRRSTASSTARSALARFVLGDGQYRPQPFPSPAGVK